VVEGSADEYGWRAFGVDGESVEVHVDDGRGWDGLTV
jgi:hypothetical protein